MPTTATLSVLAGLALAAPATAATVDFACLPDPGSGGIVGVPPVTVYCEVVPPDEGSWAEVSWTLGDGTVLYGDSVTHRYTEPGQYTLSVRLDDYEGPATTGEEASSDPLRTRYGYVTVCGEPEPEFTYVNHGELDIEVVNTTPVAFGCAEELRWELFRGRPDGEPERVWETWEPRFTVPEEGEYTLRLTMSGIAGTGVAELRFFAEHELTEDYTHGPRAVACATGAAGGGGPAWLGLVLVAAARRRRRR